MTNPRTFRRRWPLRPMYALRISTIRELEPFSDQWDALAGTIPFRTWHWAVHWWRHYGSPDEAFNDPRRLFVVCVFDHTDSLVGIAPWYVRATAAHGRVLEPLGSGEVCSDYLGLMCRQELVEPVTETIAHWLSEQNAIGPDDDHWDLLKLSAVDADDRATLRLAEQFESLSGGIHRRPGPQCWRIELPASWDEYLAGLSKSHRKQVRRAERSLLGPGRATLHTVQRQGQLQPAMDLLVDLHLRRRRSLGESSSFASAAFEGFHRDVVAPLLAAGHLQLHWLEFDGLAVAAEYHLSGGGIVYAYQSGIDPESLDAEPGSLITQATLARAIRSGHRAFDFLRGDEPYKAHWRAKPRPSWEIRIAADKASARWRQRIWRAGTNLKDWIESRG